MRRRGRNGWRAFLAERPGGTLRLVAAAGGVVLLLAVVLLWRGGDDAGRDTPSGGWTVSHWSDLLDDASARHGLDPSLLRAVVLCESGGNPDAVSSAGAHGLMQIMPMTHEEAQRRFKMEEGDLFDPAHNVEVGSRYLAYLLKRFDGDRRLAVAAYHMGPTRVARLLRENPAMSSEEIVATYAGPMTRSYVDKVLTAAG